MKPDKPSILSQFLSITILPFNVTVVIPVILLCLFSSRLAWGFAFPYHVFVLFIGGVIFILGLVIVILSIRQFIQRGKGTLAPWDPPKNLVVSGLYRYMRNPMISGVAFILLGETIFFGSWLLLIWFILFSSVNYIYFIVGEEPLLEEKFGADYREYKKNVPRLLPRRNPWKP
ncbi:isoprenylcysteine carboxylmethyltransferase family protein [Virgibacillus oceani]